MRALERWEPEDEQGEQGGDGDSGGEPGGVVADVTRVRNVRVSDGPRPAVHRTSRLVTGFGRATAARRRPQQTYGAPDPIGLSAWRGESGMVRELAEAQGQGAAALG
ncbi:hypothetical protein BZB76_4244 [Actinomadura pelletieri DSM 43383]|uniref:Uncharacterized protein n=1 Tax=Actinomadura pelletieri DSM 43383 TaxID=1120940 RepID=A0A495QM27_9ACTN|nr:hypothetical protein [Actinomadura pelletieri]RKS73548.1 hypothetical protein BZB76_4244 [Actinomadura pelletieri DSM 43383]